MDARRHQEIMALCGFHSARTIRELVSSKPSAKADPEDLRRRGYSMRPFGSKLTRRLALRLGLLGEDPSAMWRGLRQSIRLRWLELQLHGYAPTSYMHVWDALDIVATGEAEVFQRWVQAVPPRITDGHPFCVTICNALIAWGRDDPELRSQAIKGLSRTRHLSAPSRFDKAAMTLLLSGFLDDPSRVRYALDDALEYWRPNRWQDEWFYIHHVMGLFNVARALLTEDIELPDHERFTDPPRFDVPHRSDLIDFSTCAPTLHSWLETLPDELDLGAWTTKPPDDDEAQLLAAIHASPGDPAPRLVYADWLMSHAEPRGEFIALQLHEKPSKADKTLIKRLEQVHGRAWTVPLDRSRITDLRYEGGFVAACRVGAGAFELDDNPAWSTIVELNGAIPGADTPMPLLRTLGGLESLAPLEGSAKLRGVESLAYVGGSVREAAKLSEDVCPRLQELWILGQADWVQGFAEDGQTRYATPATLAWIVESPFTRSLRRLILPLPCAQLPAFVTAWIDSGRLDELLVSTQAGETWDAGWQLKITRGDKGLDLHLAGAPAKKETRPSLFEALLTGLRALPAERVHRLRCDSSVKKRGEVDELREVFPKLSFSRLPRREGFWATKR